MPATVWRWNGTGWVAPGRTIVVPSDPFVLGTTKPTELNTGSYAAPATTVTTSTSFATNDELVEDVQFDNFVSVTAKRVRFVNCIFRGPASFSPIDRGLVNCSNSNCEDIKFEHCTFRAQTPTRGLDGIFGHSFRAYRCDFSGTEDGCGVFRSGGGALRTRIEGNLFHLPHYVCPNAFQSDNRSHCDGIQVHGNIDDLTIQGNNFDWFIDTTISSWSTPTFSGSTQISGYELYPGTWGLSPMFFGVPGTVIRDVLVDANWVDGAYTSFVNVHPSWTAAATGSGFVISNNRWGRAHGKSADTYVISMNASIGPTITGNTYMDTGAAYNVRSNP